MVHPRWATSKTVSQKYSIMSENTSYTYFYQNFRKSGTQRNKTLRGRVGADVVEPMFRVVFSDAMQDILEM